MWPVRRHYGPAGARGTHSPEAEMSSVLSAASLFSLTPQKMGSGRPHPGGLPFTVSFLEIHTLREAVSMMLFNPSKLTVSNHQG